jgi:putative transcriptional regulator
MTELGVYLAKKSASKAEIAKKTGISKSRISELTLNPSTQLRVRELYLIALAIDADPGEVLKEICKDLKLSNGKKYKKIKHER